MRRCLGMIVAGSVLATCLTVVWSTATTPVVHAADTEPTTKPAPVESDMHEFMEYLFQPTYKRLVTQMAAAPENNQGWKAIKADSLILAEGGNLLLFHAPKDEQADWIKHSVQVRELGGQLYRAAKAKDYPTARQHYEAMVKSCNACHTQFAGGEHQLKP